jgi:hypothetical protein
VSHKGFSADDPEVWAAALVTQASERIHQHDNAIPGLVSIDLRYQPPKVLRLAMSIQRCLIRPLFDEDKVPGVFLIDEQVVSDAIGFQSRLLDKFGVPRANGFNVFGFDRNPER